MGNKGTKEQEKDVFGKNLARGSLVDVLRNGKWHTAKVRSVGADGTVNVVFTMYGRSKEIAVDHRDLSKRLAPAGSRAEVEKEKPRKKSSAVVSFGSKRGSAVAQAKVLQGIPETQSSTDATNGIPVAVQGETVDYIDVLDQSVPLEKFDVFGTLMLADSEGIPPPRGGWLWRPALIEDSKDNIATIRYLDSSDKPMYPEFGSVRLDDEMLIAPYMSKSLAGTKHHDYMIGDVLDILDIFRKKNNKGTGRKWRKCQVIKVTPYFIKISFVGWSKAYDEWFHVLEQKERMAEFCSKTEVETNQRAEAEKNFVEQLRRQKGLQVVSMSPDGNCLFRAVAHQIYGDVERHDVVRSDCIDYLEKNRDRFEPLLERGEFDAYLESKRVLGVWGDDPEIRAMEELYDRPVEIFMVIGDGSNTDPLKLHFEGDLPSRKVLGKVTPIRLSFHGDNHYNSVIPFQKSKNGKDESQERFKPEPLRLEGIIRKHRRVRVKSKRASKIQGFQVHANELRVDSISSDEGKESN